MRELGRVFVLGDSYSTFDGYIPQGYASYYGERENPTDVRAVEQTWWHLLVKETNSTLIQNCSWSGTTICHTGYNGEDCKDKSFIARFRKLANDGYFYENPVDTLFVFGGTNDSWTGAQLGELKYFDWTEEELYSVLPAISYLLSLIKDTLSSTRIIVVINTELKKDIAEGLKAACEYFGIEWVELESIDKMCGHPSILGMEQIKNQIIEVLKNR